MILPQFLKENKAFAAIFAGETVSEFGTGLSYVALMLRFGELTGNPDAWVWVLACKAVPFVFFGLILGQLTDRFERSTLLLGAHIGRFLCLMCLAFCQSTELFFLLVFVSAFFDALHIPTYKALTVRLLQKKDLLAANSLQETVRSIAAIAGIGASGLIVAAVGSKSCFIIDAFTYLYAAVNLLVLRHVILASTSTEESQVLSDTPSLQVENHQPMNWTARFSFLLQPAIRVPVMIAILFDLFMGLEVPMFFPMAAEKGWNGAIATGYCYAVASVGSLLSALVLMKREDSPIRIPTLASLVVICDAALVIAIAFTPWCPLAIALSFGFGITETLLRTYTVTEIQRAIPHQNVGTVFATLGSIKEPMKLSAYVFSAYLIAKMGGKSGLVATGTFEIAVATIAILGLGILAIRKARKIPSEAKPSLSVTKK